jgi:hypothetical protein
MRGRWALSLVALAFIAGCSAEQTASTSGVPSRTPGTSKAKVHPISAVANECSRRQLRLRITSNGQGLRSAYTSLAFHNRSTRACQLRGFARVELTDDGMRTLPTRLRKDRTQPFSPVLLQPHGAAVFSVISNNFSRSAPNPCPTAAGMRIWAPHQRRPWTLSVTRAYCDRGLVRLTPFEPPNRNNVTH